LCQGSWIVFLLIGYAAGTRFVLGLDIYDFYDNQRRLYVFAKDRRMFAHGLHGWHIERRMAFTCKQSISLLPGLTESVYISFHLLGSLLLDMDP
jgi:hypothetical protein